VINEGVGTQLPTQVRSMPRQHGNGDSCAACFPFLIRAAPVNGASDWEPSVP